MTWAMRPVQAMACSDPARVADTLFAPRSGTRENDPVTAGRASRLRLMQAVRRAEQGRFAHLGESALARRGI
jgi:hypothetical protein